MLQIKKINKPFVMFALLATLCGGAFVTSQVRANDEAELSLKEIRFNDKNAEKLIYSAGNYKFYYRKATECLVIEDVEKGYKWTSGLNLTKDDNNTLNQIETKFLNFANSFMRVNMYYSKEDATTYIDTSDTSRNSVKVYEVENEKGHYVLEFDCKAKFKKEGEKYSSENDVFVIKVHLLLSEKGLDVKVYDDEIVGEYKNYIKDIWLMPFLANSDNTYDDVNKVNNLEKGYVVVPDGSGSLINFQKNSTYYNSYVCDVYGKNYGFLQQYNQDFFVKDDMGASLPIYGCAKEDYDVAFVAYSNKGAEYMNIVVNPENGGSPQVANQMYTYPAFTYNFNYTEIFNGGKASNTHARLPKRLSYDIDMSYRFLNDDDANYSGMAKAYQKDLIEKGLLSKKEYSYDKTPMRVDFLLADSEESIMGKNEVVVTTTDDVSEILNEVTENIDSTNIVTSLQGWNKGGYHGNDPRKAKYSNKIASKSKLKKLVKEAKEKGIEISMSQDYVNFNEEQLSKTGIASKAVNGYYVDLYRGTGEFNPHYSIARSDKFGKWVKKQTRSLKKGLKVEAMTIEGISNGLYSHSKSITLEDSKKYTQEAFKQVKEDGLKVNADRPNSYIFNYVDRYFNTPVTDSQYIIQTSEIPFLQLVLNSTMEMFAEYSNFSFYNQNSVLTMIDYNVNPSFILTKESSHLLSTTNSSNYFSTEYSLYKDKIVNIYTQVNDALANVINDSWLNREVKGNVVINTYASGKKIYINYGSENATVDGVEISKESYEVR